jgi:uncharacterized protein
MTLYHNNTELIVLQPSSFCNIDCKYCYLPDRKVTSLMPEFVLEEIIRKILKSPLLSNEVMFLWHSGEPLAVGISYYEKALKFINQYNVNNRKIICAIQTNAILINQAWCDFFKNNLFRIGISLDGPEFLHDKNRVTRKGKGTFHKVMKSVSILKENNIKLAAICVVTRETLEYPNELFNFFLTNGFSRLSLVIEETIGENIESSLNESGNISLSTETKTKYADFMKVLFNLWVLNKNIIHIREFVELCNRISKNTKKPSFDPEPQEVKALKIITIQKNGDISTFCPELAGGIKDNQSKFVIGNMLNIHDLEQVITNENFLQINSSVNIGTQNCKNSCQYFKLCGGRSPAIKMYENGSFESTTTKHCLLHRQILADTVISSIKLLSDINPLHT